uniref:Uncharacterized protein n=1 Tax=Anguilla anguilla TaxID=7936 RepID=A0A0E9QM50_ANGAN
MRFSPSLCGSSLVSVWSSLVC